LLVTASFEKEGYAGTTSLLFLRSSEVLVNQAMRASDTPAQAADATKDLAVANGPRRVPLVVADDAQGESNRQHADVVALASGLTQNDDSGGVEVDENEPMAARGSRGVADSSEPSAPRGSPAEDGVKKDTLIESMVTGREVPDQVTVARNSSVVINLKRRVDGVEIADPAIADVYLTSPTRIVLTGKDFGATQLLLRMGQEQRAFHVAVELDLSPLQAFIKSVAPTAAVEARSVNGTIFLNGTVSDMKVAKQITAMAGLVQGGEVRSNLTIAGVQQTMLRVVVAEVNKTAMRQLGVNWAVGGSSFSRDFFFANNLGQLNPTVFGSSGVADVVRGQQLFSMAPTANGPTTNVTFGFPRAEFQVFMNALRQNNLARTLAEPNLVAISGQTASFLAGGEVPIPVTQGGAVAGAITIQYKEFGVRLSFTPTVLGGQIIRLHVMTEVSEAVPTNQLAGGLPLFTFTTRRAESTIECGNGQTFAIAGLLNDQVRAMAEKIPALGDIPVLGTLFSSTNYERSITELVVLVTPQLVEPLDPHQVSPPPGSLMTEPTDFELFTMQKLEGRPKPRPDSNGVPRDEYPVKTRPGGATSWPTSQLALRGPWGLAE